MANQIKRSGGGLALQVTQAARDAGLVEEDHEGEPTRRAAVYVYGVDGLLLVVDAERVPLGDRAQLVATAARDTGTIFQGGRATVEVAGNGYQVQLPGCADAGFEAGTTAPTVTASGLVVIHDGTRARLADDLVSMRTHSAGAAG